MKHEELPEQCKTCNNLHCGTVRMDGDNVYTCFVIPAFLKRKEEDCKEYVKTES